MPLQYNDFKLQKAFTKHIRTFYFIDYYLE